MKKNFIVLALVLTCSTMFAKQPQRPNSYNYQRGVEALVEGEVDTGIDYLNKDLEENPKKRLCPWLDCCCSCLPK